MIKLTRLNGDEFVLNAPLIRTVEARPDTYITLSNGDQFIVRETVPEVIKRSMAWARIIQLPMPIGDQSAA